MLARVRSNARWCSSVVTAVHESDPRWWRTTDEVSKGQVAVKTHLSGLMTEPSAFKRLLGLGVTPAAHPLTESAGAHAEQEMAACDAHFS
jgi:hypothetical protein